MVTVVPLVLSGSRADPGAVFTFPDAYAAAVGLRAVRVSVRAVFCSVRDVRSSAAAVCAEVLPALVLRFRVCSSGAGDAARGRGVALAAHDSGSCSLPVCPGGDAIRRSEHAQYCADRTGRLHTGGAVVGSSCVSGPWRSSRSALHEWTGHVCGAARRQWEECSAGLTRPARSVDGGAGSVMSQICGAGTGCGLQDCSATMWPFAHSRYCNIILSLKFNPSRLSLWKQENYQRADGPNRTEPNRNPRSTYFVQGCV